MVRDFLGDVLVKDASADPGKSVAAVCQKYGWETFQQELLAVMKSTTMDTMERNVRLLEQISLARPGRKRDGTNSANASRKNSSRRSKPSIGGSPRPIGGLEK